MTYTRHDGCGMLYVMKNVAQRVRRKFKRESDNEKHIRSASRQLSTEQHNNFDAFQQTCLIYRYWDDENCWRTNECTGQKKIRSHTQTYIHIHTDILESTKTHTHTHTHILTLRINANFIYRKLVSLN